jgi:hypothetical protein
MSDQAQILSLVLSVLLELRGEIEVLECTPLPMDDRYAVRLESRGEIGMAILLPRHLLERALLDPATRRTVRDVIHTAVQSFDVQPALTGRRAWLTKAEPRTWAGLRCPHCEDPIVVEAGGVGVRWTRIDRSSINCWPKASGTPS